MDTPHDQPETIETQSSDGGVQAPRCVFVHALVVFDWLNAPLMAKMRERYGTRFILYGNAARRAQFEAWLGPNDRFIGHTEGEAGEDGPIEDELRKANLYEQRLGISYLRDIVQQERGMAANMLNNTPHSSFRIRKPINLDSQFARINRLMGYFENLLRSENVDLVLARTLDIEAACLSEMAVHLGIPVTFPRASRVGGGMTWASDAYVGSDWNAAVLSRQGEAEPIDEAEIVTPEGPRQQQDKLNQTYSLKSVALQMAKTTYSRFFHIWRDIKRWRRGARLDYHSMIGGQLNSYRAFRFLRANSVQSLSELDGRRVVFFPLSLDPEYTIQSLSKEFSDTHAMVQHTALGMPAGAILAVKEHMQIGSRSIRFYKDLLQLPNVVMIDPTIRGIDVLKQAEAVISVNSTATLEAAYLGKRALIFSKHSELLPLLNVQHVADLYNMPGYLCWALEPLDDQARDRIRRDGARFRNALSEMSYDATGVRYMAGVNATEWKEDIEAQKVERALELLLEVYGFQMQNQAQAAAAE